MLSDSWEMCFQDVHEHPDGSLDKRWMGEKGQKRWTKTVTERDRDRETWKKWRERG